jgi:hypothetical protein
MSMPLLFTSDDNCLQSSASFEKAMSSTSGDNEKLIQKICNHSSQKAVKVDMVKSKERWFMNK